MPLPFDRRPGLWAAWTPLQLTAFALLLLIAQLFWQVVVFSWTGDVFVPVIVASLLAVVLPCAAAARRHGESLPAAFELKPDRCALLAGAAAGLLAVAPTSLLASFSARLRPPSTEYYTMLAEQLPRGVVETLVALVAVSLAAPLAEELVFRGLLFRLARPRWGGGRAAVLTGLFFGIAHWQPWGLFGLVALGILLALLYMWTGTLAAPIAAHAAHNAVSLALLIRSREAIAARVTAASEDTATDLAGAGGLFAGTGGWLLAALSSLLLWRLLRFLRRRQQVGRES